MSPGCLKQVPTSLLRLRSNYCLIRHASSSTNRHRCRTRSAGRSLLPSAPCGLNDVKVTAVTAITAVAAVTADPSPIPRPLLLRWSRWSQRSRRHGGHGSPTAAKISFNVSMAATMVRAAVAAGSLMLGVSPSIWESVTNTFHLFNCEAYWSSFS